MDKASSCALKELTYGITDQTQDAFDVSLSWSTKDVRNVNISQIQLVTLREEWVVWLTPDFRSRPEGHVVSEKEGKINSNMKCIKVYSVEISVIYGVRSQDTKGKNAYRNLTGNVFLH